MMIGNRQCPNPREGISMSLLDRVRNIVRANLNDAVTRAEDPVKALDAMIVDWNADLVKVRQAASLAMAAQNRLQAECEQRRQAVAEWQRRAEIAVDHGDDNLARQALSRKLQYQKEADQLQQSLEAQSGHLDELRSTVQDLENRVQQAVMQRNQLVARYRGAEATQSLEQRLATTGGGAQALERLETKTLDAEAQAAAYHSLSRDSLDEKFAQLEPGNNVDDELTTLKKQRLLGPGGDHHEPT
jgi:phage shock protein A